MPYPNDQFLGDVGRHHITCGYVRDYCCPLPKFVRPFISERDQCRTDDPFDPASSCWTGTSSGTSARKRKTSGDPCWNPPTALPIPSATWSLLRKLDGKGSNPPPNISIAFDGKTHSSLKAIARAFNSLFTTCSVQQDRAI